MSSSRLLPLLGLVSLAVANAACVRAPTAALPNPLASGQVSENELRFTDRATEMKYTLPQGTLVHEASLISADDREVCFKVKLRTEGQRRDLASPKNWRVFLRGKPGFEDMAPRFKSVERVEEESVEGTVLVSSQQNQQVCDSTGYCYTKQITTSTRVPQEIKVLSGGGTVCFANGGHLGKTTEEITLHLDDPSPPAAGMWTALQNRVAFRWKFN